jgi:hypothetical protein
MARDRLLKSLLRERFVVTMLSGEAFDGLLDRYDEAHIELVDAHAHLKDGPVKVDGRLYLPRPQVAYMQRPEAS